MGRRTEAGLKLSAAELDSAFRGSWGEKFPPVLSVDQAAALAQVPKKTIYEWSSTGKLAGCAVRRGRYLRVFRNRFLRFLFETKE